MADNEKEGCSSYHQHMRPEPCGPEVVVRQLQFDFDGIAPLTLEQRVSSWLSHQDEETPDVYTARLLLGDNESRRQRAFRWSEVRRIQMLYDNGSGRMFFGGTEVIWLYDEACHDYIDGSYFSALLCAHAACERELAGRLAACAEELPKGWMWWGLGKLVSHAVERNLTDSNIKDDLIKLTEIRKVAAHFKAAHKTPASVQWRVDALLARQPNLEYEDAINDVMQSDALFAIRVATATVCD